SIHSACRARCVVSFRVFFFIHPAPTAIYTLSLHDALPIWSRRTSRRARGTRPTGSSRARTSSSRSTSPSRTRPCSSCRASPRRRSEEHTSELQSRENLVCRLLLEKKKKKAKTHEQHTWKRV